MWLSREGFEEELLALFTAIEASHYEQALGYCLNLGKKGKRELRRLSYSINYDANNGSACRGWGKGRVANGF